MSEPREGAKVHAIFGGSPSGHPDEEIIGRIEELLERAKKGEIASIAYALTDPGQTLENGWVGQQGTTRAMQASVMRLAHDIVQSMD